MAKRLAPVVLAGLLLSAGLLLLGQSTKPGGDDLEIGFRNPPREARPHVYWLWLNGYVHPESARAELDAMKQAGFGGVLLFDMGARGDSAVQPPPGPAFLSPEWMGQFRESVAQAKKLGLQVDFSVISSWDLGGHWMEPRHASMGLYPSEVTVEGNRQIDMTLPFPAVPPGAPLGPDGRPAFWQDIAVLAARDAQRRAGHEFIFKLDPEGIHRLREVVLDNGTPRAPAELAESLTPTRDFCIEVSVSGSRDQDFKEVVRGVLPAGPGPRRFPLPTGANARYVRLRLLTGHHEDRSRLTLGEFAAFDDKGVNLAAARSSDRSRSGATILRGSPPLGYDQQWSLENLHDGAAAGATGVYASAGRPPFVFAKTADLVDLTAQIDRQGRLRWSAPPGTWTVLRYVCMNTGERLKVPSPASDGWATDHLNPEATRAHMAYVIARLRENLGDLRESGLGNLYLASYEVRGPVWSPGFTGEFKRRRGYDMTPWLPVVFGSEVGDDEMTDRFLFDYRKTLGEVLIDAYYVAAREAAHEAGLTIKSEAGGPGPPVHNVPVDALLANGAVDEIQGEFWPYTPDADALWVVKETAAAGHIYGKSRVHMEAFTSFEGWREGPQDLKPSADRVFCEGGNHMVWHTWSHVSPEAGLPGWAYLAGTHINRNVTWWPKVKPFIDYLSRASYLLQRGHFVADVLYYYGDGGYRFVGPRRNDPSLGPGYDYDVTNSDVILNRLTVQNGRFVLPDGTSYAVLVLPEEEEAHPDVLEKIAQLVASGGVVVGSRPRRAVGLEGYPTSDRRVRDAAARLWGDLQPERRGEHACGKGRVIQGVPLRGVLAEMGIAPDFTAPNTLDFIHRKDGDADVYFVRNSRPEPVTASVSFRIDNRQPELWDAVTGEMVAADVYRSGQGRTELTLSLAPYGSIFVVWRRAASGKPVRVSPAVGAAQHPAPLVLEGDWTIEFEAGRGAPERVRLGSLEFWTKHPDPGVRFFAGTGRYRKTFELPKGWRQGGRRTRLDLGRLWTIGEAWLNGKRLGISWTPPFSLDCTEALREGSNELIVEVTNTWYNRLVGDAGLAPGSRLTRTNITTSGGRPWAELAPVPSGLMGPVRLVPE